MCIILILPLLLLLGLLCDGNGAAELELSLALTATCSVSVGGGDLLVEGVIDYKCAAAHYSRGTNVRAFLLHDDDDEGIDFQVFLVPELDSNGCYSSTQPSSMLPEEGALSTQGREMQTINSHHARVIMRGGCSFFEKAIEAQRQGFSALVVVDNQEDQNAELMPPALGEDGEVHIPVVAISLRDGKRLKDIYEQSGEPLTFNIRFGQNKEEDLWENSPWYEAGSATAPPPFFTLVDPLAPQYAPTCDPGETARVSDDGWLYRQWLGALAAANTSASASSAAAAEVGGCRPLGALPACGGGGGGEGAGGSEGICIKRLPELDADAEPMADPILLNRNKSLHGLNSLSHKFPYGGRNTYPKLFKGFVIEIRGGGAIDLDGVAVQLLPPPDGGGGGHGGQGGEEEEEEDPPAAAAARRLRRRAGPALHPGGCGCCPLQRGELTADGRPPRRRSSPPRVVRVRRLVSLVQRFHGVYYHFALEALPRLLAAADYLKGDAGMQVLADTSGPYARYFLEEIFGLDAGRILPYDPNAIYVAEELLLVPAPLPCGHAPRAALAPLRRRYAAHAAGLLRALLLRGEEEEEERPPPPPPPPPGNASALSSPDARAAEEEVEFLDEDALRGLLRAEIALPDDTEEGGGGGRGGEKKGGKQKLLLALQRRGPRSVANFAELAAGLRRAFAGPPGPGGGWRVVPYAAEGRPLAEQAALFGAAAAVVAPHGSGLANLAFALRPGELTLVELLPWSYPNLTFYLLGAALGLGRHCLWAADGADAYTALRVDVPALMDELLDGKCSLIV